MMQFLGLLCYGLVLLFGIIVSVWFSGVKQNRKNMAAIISFFVFAGLLQILSWQLFGVETTKELYPLIVHLPLVVLLTVFFRCSLTISLAGVFAAYLCCQIPSWIGAMGPALFRTEISYYLVYIPAIILSLFFLKKYVAGPVSQIVNYSKKFCLLFGIVPFVYYAFDYISTTYTDWLYSGSRMAVQVFPSMLSVLYFVFIIIYYAENQKEQAYKKERDFMSAQLKQAKTEFEALSKMQDQTREYRHDMRHHFTLIQGWAAKGDSEKILEYLQTAESDIDAFTPVRYCENGTVNLLLSSFDSKASQAGVKLSVEAVLPEVVSISDTEICSLLSNSLENAITAAASVEDVEKRVVSMKIKEHKGKLLLAVENPYAGEIRMKNGLPQTDCENHGYGTRSIVAVTKLHGGQTLFSAENGIFSLKVMLPIIPNA